MPMVDASTQMTPPRSPTLAPTDAWPAGALPKSTSPQASPSRPKAAVLDEKAPVRPQAATAVPKNPTLPQVQIVSPPRTPCMAQPVALLGCFVGIGLGATMGLAWAGVLAPITGWGAAVLSVMLLLFLAGAPPFHTTYPKNNRSSG